MLQIGSVLRSILRVGLVVSAVACGSDTLPPLIRDAAAPAQTDTVDAGRPPSPPLAPNVGAACRVDTECRAPAGGHCARELDPAQAVVGLFEALIDFAFEDADGGPSLGAGDGPELWVTTPGGYCSASCNRDEECGAGAACFSAEARLRAYGLLEPDADVGGFLAEPGFCLANCSTDRDCRPGYVCRSPLQNVLLIAGAPVTIAPPNFCLPPPPPL